MAKPSVNPGLTCSAASRLRQLATYVMDVLAAVIAFFVSINRQKEPPSPDQYWAMEQDDARARAGDDDSKI
jgi:hypothetical protein